MYTCEVCFKPFSRKFNLQRHKEIKHKNEIGYKNIQRNVRGYTSEGDVNNFLNKLGHNTDPQYRIQCSNAAHTCHGNVGGGFKSNGLPKQGSFLDIHGLGNGFSEELHQQKDVYDENTLKWKHPFTCMLAGPTSCGKSSFTSRFLKHLKDVVDANIAEIVYCAPEYSYPDLSECRVPVRFLDYIPNGEMFVDKKPRLIVIDDMMRESNDEVVDLFTKLSHHVGLSVLFTTQNIFHKNKGMRDMSLNSHYIVAFKSPRDRGQFSTLARQICPENTKYIKEAFEDSTSVPYGYLVMDLTQTTPDHLRYRTNIFPDDNPANVVYVPKNFNV